MAHASASWRFCGFIFHHNGPPPYFHWEVWWYLDNTLPQWMMAEAWSQRRLNIVFLDPQVAASDIMPLPSLWLHDGYCVCTTIPAHILDLELKITEAVASLTRQRSWKNWSIRSTSAMWLMGLTSIVCKACEKLGEILCYSVCKVKVKLSL
jgi:hypothetical protein